MFPPFAMMKSECEQKYYAAGVPPQHEDAEWIPLRQVKGYSFDIVRTWTRPIDVLFIHAATNTLRCCVISRLGFNSSKYGGVNPFHDANGKWPGPLARRTGTIAAADFESSTRWTRWLGP